MKQNHHFIVPKANFRLVKGKDAMKTYTFNTHKAQHMFCSICGVQSFYIPRSNQDGYGKYINITKKCLLLFLKYYLYLSCLGIMPHCISGDVMDKSNIQIFNGQNWEEEIKRKCHIKELSKATGDSSKCHIKDLT